MGVGCRCYFKSLPWVFHLTSILFLSAVFIEYVFLVKITIVNTLKYKDDKEVALSSGNTSLLREQRPYERAI